MTPPRTPPRTALRDPKQDRSRATRRRLLEAAVACLAEHGWTRSTVAVVAERAGVSRGAAQHHFPTREDLFTAAVEHVATERSAALRALHVRERQERERAEERGGAEVVGLVGVLVDLYTGTLFRAALQLWVVASYEEQLGARVAALEARIGRETHRMAVELLGADENVPGVRESVQGFLDMARGLGLANILTDDRARRDRVVAQWARILDDALRAPH
ncbi:TetR family transcriptional regulator [Streptomyces bingchenggensis BCW-1]|uniref:TetR family transcriptional regulator n=1 Tax=Streptomyces bingchenggensis (strain BCW-1) TaxID=749414 RepID=D7C188_STRBB|nr:MULTISPECIES: TetR/AcrR family transcriptional regulator [Streptomyces]ADI07989.1 TetR family transcriptional regulator [Streptomyces bingchenggensis BCW-1]